MPGFVIAGTGGESAGSGVPNTIETYRSHRWYISQLGPVIQRESLIVAKDVTLPKWTPEKQEIVGTSIVYKYAKSVKWSDVTIIFYDTMKNPILDQLQNWQNMVFTNINGIGIHGGNGYKQNSVILELDGSGEIQRNITLNNSWPLIIDYGKLSMTDSNIKLIELTLSLDYATITSF